jgi:hypothetical protein
MLGLIVAIGVVIFVAMAIRHQVQARKLEAISRSHVELQYEFSRLAKLSGTDAKEDNNA